MPTQNDGWCLPDLISLSCLLSLSLSHPFIILTKVTKSTTHNSLLGGKGEELGRREESALSCLAVIH